MEKVASLRTISRGIADTHYPWSSNVDDNRLRGNLMTGSSPLVSIVTPVYNCEQYLPECIESVLAQTYQNWDYTIIDNCSTDGSLAIAHKYAEQDNRIRICKNSKHLRAIANHNVAFRQISPESKYSKMVFADDWLFPQCLEEMVVLAERDSSIGIVSAYGLQGDKVMWTGLPYPSRLVSGHEVCRQFLLEDTYVFGTATSLLFRSDLVRGRDPFYDESNLHADAEACVALSKNCHFAFAHQILTYKRVRSESLGMLSDDINTLIAGNLHILIVHGADFLTPEELEICKRRQTLEYYNFLAVSLLQGRRDAKFWNYHKQKLKEDGVGFSRIRLALATLKRLGRAALNPHETLEKVNKHKNRASLARPE